MTKALNFIDSRILDVLNNIFSHCAMSKFSTKLTVDKLGVNKLGVYEMGVHETGST